MSPKVSAWLAPRHNRKIDMVANLADFAYCVVCVWGSVEVFGKRKRTEAQPNRERFPHFAGAYASWESEDSASALYCHRAPFCTAFVCLVGFWIFVPLCCLFGCIHRFAGRECCGLSLPPF